MKNLKVEIVEFIDDRRWSWRLLDQDGSFVTDHKVELDEEASEFQSFLDLPAFVGWNADPDVDSEFEVMSRIGLWVRDEVWGPMAPAILSLAKQEPVTVAVELPPEAGGLLYRPLELPFVFDPADNGVDVSLVYGLQAKGNPPSPLKHRIGERLRMLALFSTPADEIALNIRFERDQLQRLVERVVGTTGKAIELRILQYGVTRQQLADILEESEGWDLIHFSGHGLAEGLVLETEDGSADLVPSIEFSRLLRPVRAQLKLVTLSSCESGSAAAAQVLQSLGVAAANGGQSPNAKNRGKPLPAAAQRLVEDLGCAVLAMRYPVEDGFAIQLSVHLYERLLKHGQNLPGALQAALRKTREQDPSPIALATPALFGAAAAALRLEPPQGKPKRFDVSESKISYFEPEPPHFVGRVAQLARSSAALAPQSSKRAVLFFGMAGAGKTACALELAYGHKERRFEAMAWHRAPNEGEDISDSLPQFVGSLENQLEGFEFAHALDDTEKLRNALPQLTQLLEERSIFIALDNAESLLTQEGRWRDERWALFVDALISHDGLSRLVLTSRLPPSELHGPQVLIEKIDALSASESALLAQQLPHLGHLMSSQATIGQPRGRDLVRRTLEIVQGHPKLIEMAEHAAADAEVLEQRLGQAHERWAPEADLTAFFRTGEADDAIAGKDFLQVLEGWTEAIADTLSPPQRFFFQLLCCLNRGDRRHWLVDLALPPIWEKLGSGGPVPEVDSTAAHLARQGLIEVDEPLERDVVFRIHPAVEKVGRGEVAEEVARQIDDAMSSLWEAVFFEGYEREERMVILPAGLAAAPYLLRLGLTERTIEILRIVRKEDPAPRILAQVLPLLRRAFDLSTDPAERRHARAEIVRCHIGLGLRDADVVPEMEELMAVCRDEGDMAELAVVRATLFNELFRRGRLREAETLLDPSAEPELADEFEALQVSDAIRRLNLMQALGENEEVLKKVDALLSRVNEIPDDDDQDLQFNRAGMREAILEVARRAAVLLADWNKVLEFNGRIRQSEEERDAPAIERARSEFNDHPALLELGRLEEAEDCLRRCRLAAERAEDPQFLGRVFDAWASLENKRGHLDEGLSFARRALQNSYRFQIPHSINVRHHNLANHLQDCHGDPEEITAHRLAEVLISHQTDSGEYPGDVQHLAATIVRHGPESIPKSFDDLCTRLQESCRVDYARFFADLPRKSPDGETAMKVVLKDAFQIIDIK